MKGNVVDMAVGIVIGAAFGKIVSAFVNAIVMPALGWMIGGVDFSNLGVTLGDERGDRRAGRDPATASSSRRCVDFLIIAAAIFMALKAINRLKKPAAGSSRRRRPAAPSEVLLTEIRDLLRQQR